MGAEAKITAAQQHLARCAQANKKLAKGLPPGELRQQYVDAAEMFSAGAECARFMLEAQSNAAKALSLLGGTGAASRTNVDTAKAFLRVIVAGPK